MFSIFHLFINCFAVETIHLTDVKKNTHILWETCVSQLGHQSSLEAWRFCGFISYSWWTAHTRVSYFCQVNPTLSKRWETLSAFLSCSVLMCLGRYYNKEISPNTKSLRLSSSFRLLVVFLLTSLLLILQPTHSSFILTASSAACYDCMVRWIQLLLPGHLQRPRSGWKGLNNYANLSLFITACCSLLRGIVIMICFDSL